jgi:hypothetical protein
MSRIAFCGSHGTGKSTLIHDHFFKWFFQDHLIIDSVVRQFPVNGDTAYTVQHEINKTYFYQHRKNKNFVSARSIFDIWAYSRISIDKDFDKWYFNIYKTLIHYDYLFYIPIEIKLKNDNFRPLNLEYQEKIDKEIKYLLDKYNIKYHTITGTIQERIDKIEAIIL